MAGKVVIIGAGPGPADLLTVRAVEALRKAEVVLHDALVSNEVLALCPTSAQVVDVGKRCGRHAATQELINRLMVRYARCGFAVARLKSGDPAIFGRLGEELQALREAEIPFEIVPGVTAVAAAAAAAEMTLTDRRWSSTLTILAAHSAGPMLRRRDPLGLERRTFAIYMPGPDYGRTAKELMDSGIEDSTPCVVVSNACRPSQQVRFLSLAELAFAQGILAPAVLIVGRVAARSSEIPTAEIPTLSLPKGRDPSCYEEAWGNVALNTFGD
jgi:uroporphyrin-III C-methyltransferase